MGTVLLVLLPFVALAALAPALLYVHIRRKYLDHIVRIFEERPLFVIPRGKPVPNAEEVFFLTGDGPRLHGCYLRSPHRPRLGVVLFGLEFGSNCWASVPYCEGLLAAGFDIFTFETRSTGESDAQLGYEPLQWVTEYEVRDYRAALAYLRSRQDADPRGVGFFGMSKGAGAGLLAAADDPYVLCCVTDGCFATHTTMVPYMQKWIAIYSDRHLTQRVLPRWVYGYFGGCALRRAGRRRGCRFPHLEQAIARLAPRPLLMIHGGADTYIKPDMARELFVRALAPKEFWLVEGAKHNQALNVANGEYHNRVLQFFLSHLAPLQSRAAERELAEATDPA